MIQINVWGLMGGLALVYAGFILLGTLGGLLEAVLKSFARKGREDWERKNPEKVARNQPRRDRHEDPPKMDGLPPF